MIGRNEEGIVPIKGSQRFAVLLCKFEDSPDVEPQTADFFRELVADRDTGGLNDYWRDASLGAINLDGSEVFDWKMLDSKRADYLTDRPDRASKIAGAVEAHGVDRTKYTGVIALFSEDAGDAGAAGRGILGGPNDYNVTFLAHEVGHVLGRLAEETDQVLGLDHSYDQSDRKTNTWSAPGEYFFRHDIMSAMNVDTTTHDRFGLCGPLMCTGNLDRMGWLPQDRVWTEPTSSSFSQSVNLTALGHPEQPGYLAARIAGYYVELRSVDGWDAGIPRATVLIHGMNGANAFVYASDEAAHIHEWLPGQTFGKPMTQVAITGGVRISVAGIDPDGRRAQISVTRTAAKQIGATGYGKVVVGDGWLLLKDVLYRVPPKGGPLHRVYDSPAVLSSSRTAAELPAKIETVQELLRIIDHDDR